MTTSAVSQINVYGSAQNVTANAKNGQNDSFSQIFATQAENKAETDALVSKTEENRKINNDYGKEEVNDADAKSQANDVQEATK